MARQIRRFGKWMLFVGPLALLVLLLARPAHVQASTFTTPFWTNASTNIECACDARCGVCSGPSAWGADGVSRLSREFRHGLVLWTHPGMVVPFTGRITWRSGLVGASQFGHGWLPSWEYTVQVEILNSSDPEGVDGHTARVNYPNGIVVLYTWTGSAYATSSCTVKEVLTRPSGPTGPYRLTFVDDATLDFNAAGVPSVLTDRHGNTTTYTYNSAEQITSIRDDRGFDTTFTQGAHGFVEEIEDPTGRTWTFDYDVAGNLTSVTTPATTQQPSGVVFEFGYDAYGRMTSVKDGRGTTVKSIAYVGTGYEVDSLTMNGNMVDYIAASGRTDRTDRLGNVHRTHYSGNKITQRDMWISGAATYVHTYAYGGDDYLAYEVLPRGNRIDYDWDADGNLLEKRHKTSNTGSTSGTDIVHTWTYADAFVATYTDPLGNVTEFTRNAAGDVTQVDYPDVTSPTSQTASETNTYNAYGQITQRTDEEGKVTAYTYFTSGADIHLLEREEVDPSGLDLATTYGYDAHWNVDSITDPRGHTTTFVVDALGRRIEEIAPSTLSYLKYEYDGDGRVTKKSVQNRDKDNAVVTSNPWWDTTYAYTTLGDLASVTEEIAASVTRATSYDYDDEQRRIRVTRPEGNKVKTEYDARGLVTKEIRGETSSGASQREYTYDANGNLVEDKDGRGNDTTHAFDMFDRRTRTTNAMGHYIEWTLDKRGMAIEIARKDVSDTVLLKRERSHDERGRTWRTKDLHKDPGATYADAVTVIQRTRTGHVSTVTDARGKVTTREYDNAWRETKVIDHAGNFTAWTLDEGGNPTGWTIHDEDAAGDLEHEYAATYDALGRRLTEVEIDRTNSSNTYVTTNGYDSRGNLVWQVNAEGNPTRWVFDGLSRKRTQDVALTVSGALTNFTAYLRTQWGYDKNDRLTSIKDDAGNETTLVYDELDRVSGMTYPDASTVAYTHDANDNVTQTIDAAGNDIDDTYDSLNRRTARSVTRATGVLDTTAESFTYDGADRLLSAQDDDYKVEFTHGTLGLTSNVYEEKQQYATGTAYLRTVTTTYDAVGNKATEVYPSTFALGYTYTDANQLSTITSGLDVLATYDYVGRLRKRLTLGNGSQTQVVQGAFRGEVATLDHEDASGNTLLQLDYGYNKVHDRTFERYGSSGQPGDAFEYYKARRLRVAWMGSDVPASPSGNVHVKKIQYMYDDDGNRTTVGVTPYGGSTASTAYTDNSLNQYTAAGGTSRLHDDNGNVSDDGTYLYEYNYKNLVCRVKLKSSGTTVATYKYDALGRRVEKAVTGATYRYICSDVETVSVYTSTGTWKQDYVYGPNVDEVLMLEQADVLDWDGDSNTAELTRSWYRANALGSVMRVEEHDRSEAVSYRYDPYGVVRITRGGTQQSSDPLGQYVTFTGRVRDEETALYHYRARTYDPVHGRFLQRDPLGGADGPNLYEYAKSDPCNRIDPTGERSFWEWVRDVVRAIRRYPEWVSDELTYVWMCLTNQKCACLCTYTFTFPGGKKFSMQVAGNAKKPIAERAGTCTCGDHKFCAGEERCASEHVRKNVMANLERAIAERDAGQKASRAKVKGAGSRRSTPDIDKDSDWVPVDVPAGSPTGPPTVEGKCQFIR